MTSESTFPNRLTKIDELMLPDHYYLDEEDVCYFLGEYTAGVGYAYSATNSLISNFKKSMERRGRAGWSYKAEAIQQVATAFRTALGENALIGTTFVPIPPSKAKNDPLYDDRMTQALRAMRPSPPLDVREIIVQQLSMEAAHVREDRRPPPQEISDGYGLDQRLFNPSPTCILIVDDVLTTGSHFRAAKMVLAKQFPATPIIGLFIARRVPNTSGLR